MKRNFVLITIIMMVSLSALFAGALTAEDAEEVLWVREEEKLARDVYLTLYEQWGLTTFKNIAESIDARFLIVGDGPLRENIQQECSKYNLPVEFIGRVPQHDVFKYMHSMDVLILPSRKEGFGCVAIEAQACGVPVVGSDQGGIPEAIGDGGFVVPEGPEFDDRFAAEVVKSLDSNFESESLRKRASSFDWKNIIEQEMRVYEEVIEGNARSS